MEETLEQEKVETATTEFKVDTAKIESIQKQMEDLAKELSMKEYAVKMDSALLEFYENFMNFQSTWKGKQALGIIEILKKIAEVKASGIKDNVIYMKNLHIEATHYFLDKYEGKGSSIAVSYIELYKSMENVLQLVSSDNARMKDLEKELIAAQQGIETC